MGQSDPREVFLRMQERWGDENPEAIWDKKAEEDKTTRDQIKRMVAARHDEERKRKMTEAARQSPNAGRSKLFRLKSSDYQLPSDYSPQREVIIKDREDDGN